MINMSTIKTHICLPSPSRELMDDVFAARNRSLALRTVFDPKNIHRRTKHRILLGGKQVRMLHSCGRPSHEKMPHRPFCFEMVHEMVHSNPQVTQALDILPQNTFWNPTIWVLNDPQAAKLQVGHGGGHSCSRDRADAAGGGLRFTSMEILAPSA